MALVPVTEGRVGWLRPLNRSTPIRVAVLGSTGSVGSATLAVLRQNPEHFSLLAVSAGANLDLFERQIREFSPRYAYLAEPAKRKILKSRGKDCLKHTTVFDEESELLALLRAGQVDLVVAAVVGFEGLPGVIAAIEGGAVIALANKESLVSAGELISTLLNKSRTSLIPVDSEHSAIFQALQGEKLEDISELVVTASGGPFLHVDRSQFSSITPADALKHPTWNMGGKITIDSATMVNKAFELAEAHWLFGVPTRSISVLVHPQSILHSMVNFKDGSSIAQLGVPDMKVPIAYALNYPDGRLKDVAPALNLAQLGKLEFLALDHEKFRGPSLMLACVDSGGIAAAVFTIANDIAVKAFLDGKISFDRIVSLIEEALERHGSGKYSSLSDLLCLRDTLYADLTV